MTTSTERIGEATSTGLIGVLACWGAFQQIALTPVGATIARYSGLAFFLHSAHFR